jgi:Tol biopolymer transport system component
MGNTNAPKRIDHCKSVTLRALEPLQAALVLFALATLAGSAFAQALTQRSSVSTSGTQASGDSGNFGMSISPDGRFVAFTSFAGDLVAGDVNGFADVFVHDRMTGVTELVSVASSGAQGNGDSYFASISDDGRYVAFVSQATNLVPVDTNGVADVFVRDRQLGTTQRVSISTSGAQGDLQSGSTSPSISGDGHFVAFDSNATTLVALDLNGSRDVFVRDLQNGTTELVSVDSNAVHGNGASYGPSISFDGRWVAFASDATNLVTGDTNGVTDIFVRDRVNAATARVSVNSTDGQANGQSLFAAISGDGHFVAFQSVATNLVAGDTNGSSDVFVHDLYYNTTERVSVDSNRVQGNSDSSVPSISHDGRFVTFESTASNLVTGDVNGFADVFLRDQQTGTTELVSVDSTGALANGDSGYHSGVSSDGRFVIYSSRASNLVANDTNDALDVFMRDRNAAGLTSVCDPGALGVVPCPCSNPPSGAGHGCNNSSATGGAVLTASGLAYLSMDDLVFTTHGETPSVPSILLQGHGLDWPGRAFGAGVLCVGGTLERLYLKYATAGSITAPNLAAGDLTVSARSAALGDPIAPGTRYYTVYYRDPIGIPTCSVTSTYNATSTGQVTWWP